QRPCQTQYPSTQAYPGPGAGGTTSACGCGGASVTTTSRGRSRTTRQPLINKKPTLTNSIGNQFFSFIRIFERAEIAPRQPRLCSRRAIFRNGRSQARSI